MSYPNPSCKSANIFGYCCEDIGIPAQLYVTFQQISGSCSCLDGVTVPIAFNNGLGYWRGMANPCESEDDMEVTFDCGGDLWAVDMHGCGDFTFTGSIPTDGTCDPFELISSIETVDGICCNYDIGNFRVIVTE